MNKLALNRDDVTALVKGLIITMLAAGLTFIESTVAKMDFGSNTTLVMTVNAFFVNLIRKVLDGVMPKIVIETSKPAVSPTASK